VHSYLYLHAGTLYLHGRRISSLYLICELIVFLDALISIEKRRRKYPEKKKVLLIEKVSYAVHCTHYGERKKTSVSK